MREPEETFEQDGFTVKLYQDDDAPSPRECDQLGIMVHWHRNYELGDRKATETEMKALRRGGFKLLERYLRLTEGAIEGSLIPLGLLDHSGLHMYAGGGASPFDPGGWDSGTVGFIYATKATVEMTGAPLDSIEKQLRGEIDEYDQWLRGDVYGYVVEGPDGNRTESCWGYFGYKYAEEEAKAALQREIAWEAEQAKKVAEVMAL